MSMYSKLSKKTVKWIHKSIADCIFHPQYSVGMFFNSKELRSLFADGVQDFINNIYGCNEIECITHSSIATSIKFTNDSAIDLFNVDVSPNWNARRYACIIYDKAIDKLYIINLIKRLRVCFERNGEDLSKMYEIKFR